MLVKLIKEAALYGWHVVASADVSAKVKIMQKWLKLSFWEVGTGLEYTLIHPIGPYEHW